MRDQLLLFLSLLLLGVDAVSAAGAEKVLGCGGFIQSSRAIEFSRIDVQLFSKQGILKYQTDCAPNNGYFFIPIYEMGEYVLKVK